MPRRDPQTGQFVSSDSPGNYDWQDIRSISGVNHMEIPAADLAGGTGTSTAVGHPEAQIVDFTNVLDQDEVFRVLQIRANHLLYLPTTSTAESSSIATFEVSEEPNGATALGSGGAPTHYGGNQNASSGIIDIGAGAGGGKVSGVLYTGEMTAEASLGDSVNGLGAGAAPDRLREVVEFQHLGGGPIYDADDELYVPTRIGYENISDHAIQVTHNVLVRGLVEELD